VRKNTIRWLLPVPLAVAIVATASGIRHDAPRTVAADVPSVFVTNTGDSVEAGESECPSATMCTLRRAIELANADAGAGSYVVGFDPAAFPPGGNTTIQVLDTPLPALTRPDGVITAVGSGVTIDGSLLPAGPSTAGIALAGAGTSLSGVRISSFSTACVIASGEGSEVGGDRTVGRGNVLDRCSTGVLVTRTGVTVAGNDIGLQPGPTPGAMTTAVLVNASQVTIGGLTPSVSNAIGNAATGVQVGQGSGAPISGVVIRSNTIGRNRSSAAAPLTVGVALRQPSNGSFVAGNEIAFAATGIAVAADVAGVSTTGNRLRENRFANLGGLAIDLGSDGILNPNDPADVDTGPNSMLNHPGFHKAIQSQITGTVGPECAGCLVDLYLADHLPGSPNDFPVFPVAPETVIADDSGQFVFNNPAVSPGQWVIAIVTDVQGNTSEFGAATRVGAGLVQCGNVSLHPGWNTAGFFGTQVILGAVFPEGSPEPGPVAAIHSLVNGSESYVSWFSPAGSSGLTTLTPGDAYWYYATGTLSLPGGFALNAPLPVALHTGWNDFLYIGAGAAGLDAFASIAGKYAALYRYENDGSTSGWRLFGNESTPAYVRGFDEAQPCTAYRVLMTEPATLVPLQP
jgi:hypothetical protein